MGKRRKISTNITILVQSDTMRYFTREFVCHTCEVKKFSHERSWRFVWCSTYVASGGVPGCLCRRAYNFGAKRTKSCSFLL